MIGNDIIDLQLAKRQSNWERKGFLEKQFTDEEQNSILNSKNPFLQVWLFWSMKEAAYKCFTQKHKKRFFAPKKFICKMVSKTLGYIKIGHEVYFSTSLITDNYIHTIASNTNEVNVNFNLFFIDAKSDQTKFLNNKLITIFSEVDAIKKDELGIPFLYNQQKKLPISISISHHGNYGGFATLNTEWI
jgi:phosphopantetheinyl transferase (holo-ACP synthase)